MFIELPYNTLDTGAQKSPVLLRRSTQVAEGAGLES